MEEVKNIKLFKIISQILSVMFFPGLIPLYGLLIIFYAPTIFAYELEIRYGNIKQVIFFLAMINMTIVPIAVMPLLKYRNIISSYNLKIREERLIPMSIGSIMYVITTIIFYSFHIPHLIKVFVLAASLTSIIILLITVKYKISLHAAGMGSLLATAMTLSLRMYANLITIWLPLIILASMVMAARLYLNSHKPNQVYTGFTLGFLVFWMVMMP